MTSEFQNECPYCFKSVNRATSVVGDHKPSPNDYSLCAGCGAVSVFDDNLNLRIATDDDMEDMDEENKRITSTIKSFIQQANAKNPTKGPQGGR